jgi:hypothetical protein
MLRIPWLGEELLAFNKDKEVYAPNIWVVVSYTKLGIWA